MDPPSAKGACCDIPLALTQALKDSFTGCFHSRLLVGLNACDTMEFWCSITAGH